MDQQRVVDVFLNNESPLGFVRPSDDLLDFLHRFANFNAVTAVGVFTGFDDPCVLGNTVLPLVLLHFSVVFRVK